MAMAMVAAMVAPGLHHSPPLLVPSAARSAPEACCQLPCCYVGCTSWHTLQLDSCREMFMAVIMLVLAGAVCLHV